jgi:RimJ/RimL family protein N-acetyltransferase
MFQDILTDRLHLRCLKQDDAERMFEYRSHPEVVQYQSWEPESLPAVRSFINSMLLREFNTPGWHQIGIALRSAGSLTAGGGGEVGSDSSRTSPVGDGAGSATSPTGGGSLIGDCGIHVLKSDPRIVEIAITIAPDCQSRGYATEAVNALLDHLLVRLGKHRVFASVDPRNLNSMALMQRIGLRKEAHFVQSLWFKGGWTDDVVFAMLAGEWRSQPSKK